ncbi:uncharacterized protein LOC132926926 [Rhopalosiphum padi]|uniref:uncharacterized protein LOC132926926 n=1 Tax=Rhopalosiphum padi TaxID=40932 RepID=UPI00298E139C|nr:uncharacterized protein LOC132926926 [Rhopalosiphum padi]
MNNRQISKEIKVRLNKVCNLLKEIEDILCREKNENQMSQLSKLDYSCNCVCVKHSTPQILSEKLEKVSNHRKDENSRICEKMYKPCFEKHVKCKVLDKGNMSSDINNTSPCCQKNDEDNRENNNSISPNVLCCNISNKQFYNNTQNDCMHELFKNKINCITQKYMSYFDEINKNEPNTTICSTINSKRIPRK